MTPDEYQQVVTRLTGPYLGDGALSRAEDRYVYYRAVTHTMARALPLSTLRALCDLLGELEFSDAVLRLAQHGLLVAQERAQDQQAVWLAR
jgi:hypothetical protein